jgi:hypothetical protein
LRTITCCVKYSVLFLLRPSSYHLDVNGVALLLKYDVQLLQVLEYFIISQHFSVDLIIDIETEGADLPVTILLIDIFLFRVVETFWG